MDTSRSVSKGCFAFKGKKKNANIENYLPRDKNGTLKSCYEQFVCTWESIDVQIQMLLADINSNIFEELLKFTATRWSGFGIEIRPQQSSFMEIPTAALVTGVNTPDHHIMFADLVAMILDRVTPLVAILKAKDCQTVKGILSNTLTQFLDHSHGVMDEDEGENDELSTKALPLTLSLLVKWYNEKYKTKCSPPKKRKSNDNRASSAQCPPVVIVFEDFECFLPKVVQDFIIIASNYIDQLPLVFVFGIATSVSAVHRLLPNEVSSLLCIEKFQAPPSTDYIAAVINKIVMTDAFSFKVGGKVFQLMLDIFLFNDFSVLNFINALRFALMDHYFTQPLSYLCCPLADVENLVDMMDGRCLDKLRQLPSFVMYVEKSPVSEQSELCHNSTFTKGRVLQLIRDVHSYHLKFFPVLKCLHIMVAKLPTYPLGKSIREVYCLSLESNIFESESYCKAKDLLKMLAKDELKTSLAQCSNIISESKELANVHQVLEEFIQRINKLDEIVEEEMEPVEVSLPSRTSLHQLRQKLQDIGKQKKRLSPYEKLRVEIVDYLDEQFKKLIVCPSSQPLHEIFYYNSIKRMKQLLNASPRSAIQMALSNPQHYIQCDCCTSDDGQVMSTMPDIAILYKLHLECGQLINLYDWLQAFVTVVQPDDDSESSSSDKLLQFIRGVSELQFLGFIKPTKRKTDHVARLTWGGC